jgi:hypothetical protein
MAIDSNVLLKAIVPDAIGAAKQGFALGDTIRNAPLLRKLKEQDIALNEQKLALNEQKLSQNEQNIAQGGIEAGQAESLAIFQIAGDTPITAENYEQTVRLGQRGGLPFQEDDLVVSEQNIADLETIRQTGSRAFGQTSQGANKFQKGASFITKDKEGGLIVNTPVFDPRTNTSTINQVPVTSELVSNLGETGDEETLRLIEQAGGKAKASEIGSTEGAAAVIEQTKENIRKEGEAAIEVSASKIESDARAKDLSETNTKLRKAVSTLPALKTVIGDLGKLEEATFTLGGKAYDTLVKELGGEPREAALQREEMLATINQQVLPKLRDMLGAAFTEKESEKVLALYGDPNSHPKARKRALGAMLRASEIELQRLRRHKKSFSEDEQSEEIKAKQARLDELRATQ